MATTALIKFTQGPNTDLAGRAVKGTLTDGSVVVTNGDNTDVLSWKFEILYVPPGSSIPLTTQGPGPLNSLTFSQPDVAGSYRVRLTAYSGAGGTGTADIDIRNFCVAFAGQGFIAPPYQGVPPTLPLTGVGAKPNEMNLGGQLFGWDGTDSLVHRLMYQLVQHVSTSNAVALTSTAPVNVTKAAADVGVGTTAARHDHKHDISTAAPVAVGSSNQEGAANTLARSNHVHDATVLPTQQAALTFNNFPVVGQKYTQISPAAIAATTTDYNPTGFPTADVVRITLTGSQTISGMKNPAAGENRRKIFINVDTTSPDEKLTFLHDQGSTAAQRFSLPQAQPFVLGPGEMVEFVYDDTLARWVVVACCGELYDSVSAWFREELNRGDQGASVTITFKNAQKQRVRMTGNVAITLTFPGVGNYQLKLVQDGTGGRVPTFTVTNGSLKRPGGVLVVTSAAGAEDILSLYYDGINAYGALTANFN